MIKNNLLEDILNLYKNGKHMKPPSEKEKNITVNVIDNTKKDEVAEPIKSRASASIILIYQILEIIFKSIIFGIAIKTVLKTNWGGESIFAVGFTLNYILFYIHKLLKNKK